MDLWVNVKFMKAVVDPDRAASRPAVRLLADDPRVFVMPCPTDTVDNPRETILALCVPRRSNLVVRFTMATPVRRVLVEGRDVPFQIAGDELTVLLPARDTDARANAELHGFISRPGIQIRVELPDPLRAAGAYADGPFPEREVRVTLAMQFALLEACLAMGLDRSVGLTPLGPISIMGFDTNNPQGHTDAPPHCHIHPHGPRYFAPITHYYYGPDGRLARNKLGHRAIKGQGRILTRGETFAHRDLSGGFMYATTITEDGGLRITGPSGASAEVTPTGGDSTDVTLSLAGRNRTFSAQMCLDSGHLSVHRDGEIEVHEFDVDTGQYLGTGGHRPRLPHGSRPL